MDSCSVESIQEEWQLFLNGLDGRTKIININENAAIEDLFHSINEKTGISVDEMRVIYTTKELRRTQDGKKQYLSDYRIQNNSNLTLVLRLRGGAEQRKVLPYDVERSDEPDMITLEDEEDTPRAKMPCGHAIGPESLTDYCRSQLGEQKYEFKCPYQDPHCGQLWEFCTIKHIAVLTEAEIQEFETRIAENYLRSHMKIQDCPKCFSFCQRNNITDRQVICPLCTQKNGRDYKFCFLCLKPWLTNNTQECGNSGCSSQDPLKILRDCPKKTIYQVENCPTVRACPTCGRLIEHRDACKHMDCPCKQKFCFVCLKKADSAGKYQCGSYSSSCDVAPIQSCLP